MRISNLLEKMGKAIFESPFGSGEVARDTPELAEIRLAILDEVKAKSHRVSGRQVFPYNLVRIRFRGVGEEQAALLRGRFFSQFCEQEVRSGLLNANYRFPEDLQIEVETTPELPVAEQRWLAVETESRVKPEPVPQTRRAARLVVVRGDANQAEVLINKARTNIGRTMDVYRADGPSRRNDLAFAESGEISGTVSREHAHILYSKKTGEYRLFNDRYKKESNSGLWIIRDGLSRAVQRDSRGARLQTGDEIHLGQAIVRFIVK